MAKTLKHHAQIFNDFKSSNIKEFKHLSRNNNLEVEFHHGGTYLYKNVPKEILAKVLAADSVTKEFNELIKNKFPTSKLS